MTEENQRLRDKLQSIEQIVTSSLASQPYGDEECGEHLRNAISDIKREIMVKSLADVMHEACVAAHEDGDDALCKRYDCPYHGEPNGCNSPTGYFDVPPADSAPMRTALLQLRDGELAFCEKNVEKGVGLSSFGLGQHCNIVRGIIESALSAKNEPPCNSAAMRDALMWIYERRWFLDFCRNNLADKIIEDWDKVYNLLRELIDHAMVALSTPMRNCDRFKTAAEAMDAWLEEVPDDEVDWTGPCKWLFAPVTEGWTK